MSGKFIIIPIKFRILLLLALFLTALFAVPVQAQQGLLLLEKGSAKVIGPKRTRLLRKPGAKMVLEPSDRVQTGKDTSVKIKVRGKPELIELSSRSFFRMGKITRETSSISLLTGKAQFKIKGKLKKKSKKKRFQIRTVTALIGVRGTDFVVGATNTQTSLLTISGTVSVAPVSMPDIEIDVPANQASTIPQDSPPTAPVEVAPKLRQQIVKGDSPGAFKNVKFGQTVDPEEVRKENAEKKKKEEEEEKRQEEENKNEEKKGEPGEKKDGEPKPGEKGAEGEGEPGDKERPPGEREEGQGPKEGEEGPGGKGPRGPGMPGEGDQEEGGMMMGPGGEEGDTMMGPGGEEGGMMMGPGGQEGGMMTGSGGQESGSPGVFFRPDNEEGLPGTDFKPGGEDFAGPGDFEGTGEFGPGSEDFAGPGNFESSFGSDDDFGGSFGGDEFGGSFGGSFTGESFEGSFEGDFGGQGFEGGFAGAYENEGGFEFDEGFGGKDDFQPGGEQGGMTGGTFGQPGEEGGKPGDTFGQPGEEGGKPGDTFGQPGEEGSVVMNRDSVVMTSAGKMTSALAVILVVVMISVGKMTSVLEVT